MTAAASIMPIPYTPADEEILEDEAEIGRELTKTMLGIQEKTWADTGRPLRSVHAKALGVFEGEMRVLDGLPAAYSHGLFAAPGGARRVVFRLSSIPGDMLDDSITVPRGLSLKVFGAEGPRLPGAADDGAQDFVLVNGPYFQNSSPKKFLAALKLLAATTDRIEGVKKAVSATNRALEATLEAFGGGSANLKAMGGAPMTHPLGDTFYSQGARCCTGPMWRRSRSRRSPPISPR